jgi:hypothetical protein
MMDTLLDHNRFEVARFFVTRRVSFEVARSFVTRRVSEENLILLRSSLTRRVTIFQRLSRKRNFKTLASGCDPMAQPWNVLGLLPRRGFHPAIPQP